MGAFADSLETDVGGYLLVDGRAVIASDLAKELRLDEVYEHSWRGVVIRVSGETFTEA